MATDPVRRVSVVSTGSVRIRPEHVGPTRLNTYVWLLTSRRWTAPRPVNAYVIEHEQGLVLFDTGQDLASLTDPDYFPRGVVGFLYGRLAMFDIAPEQTLPALLHPLGYSIDDVAVAALSHLHEDHIGGLPHLTGARILLAHEEWTAAHRRGAELRGFLRKHIDLPELTWDPVTMEPLGTDTVGPFDTGYDVFGDGSLLLLPTPGHTPGSMSLLVRRAGRVPLLLVGDLTYDARLLETGQIPGVGHRASMHTSVDRVNVRRSGLPGLVPLAAHDPAAADALAMCSAAD